MKQYKEYKESGVEWIGEIPVRWEVKKLKYVITCNDEVLNEKTDSDVQINYVEISDVRLEKGIESFTSLKYSEAPSRARRIVKKDDIIISTVRTYLKAITRIKKEHDGFIVSTGFAVLRPKKIDSSFLGNIVSCERFIEEIISKSVGVSYPAINASELIEIPIPFPSINEQKAIAKFIDYHTILVNTIITKKKELIEKLKEQRQACINQAVTKGLNPIVKMKDSGIIWLGDIPEHWEIAKMKFLTRKIVDGTHFTPTYVENGVPFLRVTDIQQKEIDLSKVKFIPISEHLELSKRCKPERGDILLSKNGTIGITKVVDWDWEFSLFVSLCLIKLNDKLESGYFSYFFSSSIVNQQVKIGSKTTSVTNLHLDKIKELLIAFPKSNSEQIEISNYLDIKTKEIDQMIFKINVSLENLKSYRQSLIFEAVTGKLDLRDWQEPINH